MLVDRMSCDNFDLPRATQANGRSERRFFSTTRSPSPATPGIAGYDGGTWDGSLASLGSQAMRAGCHLFWVLRREPCDFIHTMSMTVWRLERYENQGEEEMNWIESNLSFRAEHNCWSWCKENSEWFGAMTGKKYLRILLELVFAECDYSHSHFSQSQLLHVRLFHTGIYRKNHLSTRTPPQQLEPKLLLWRSS